MMLGSGLLVFSAAFLGVTGAPGEDPQRPLEEDTVPTSAGPLTIT